MKRARSPAFPMENESQRAGQWKKTCRRRRGREPSFAGLGYPRDTLCVREKRGGRGEGKLVVVVGGGGSQSQQGFEGQHQQREREMQKLHSSSCFVPNVEWSGVVILRVILLIGLTQRTRVRFLCVKRRKPHMFFVSRMCFFFLLLPNYARTSDSHRKEAETPPPSPLHPKHFLILIDSGEQGGVCVCVWGGAG